MKFLLDTVVISEFRRLRPEPAVLAWSRSHELEDLCLSALTIGEIRKGIELARTQEEAQRLVVWLVRVTLRYEGRILPVTRGIAERWGTLTGAAARRGRVLPPVDGLIGATAREHGLTVVTRDVRHFEDMGVPVLNPWEPT